MKKKKPQQLSLPATDNKKHATFGSPSTLSRHKACPGNVAYTKDLPAPPESSYAAAGTLFHCFMQTCLPHYIEDDMQAYEQELRKCEDTEMRNTIEDTCVKMQEKWSRFRERHAGCKYVVEQAVAISEDIFGTADVVFIGKNIKNQKTDIVVFDYKYGLGVIVNAEENLQITAYLLGAIKVAKISYDDIGRAVGFIAQVRLVDKEWENYSLEGKELQGKEEEICEIVERVKFIATEATTPIESYLHAGKHCKFCKADGICIAQKQAHTDLIDATAVEHDIDERVKTLTLDEQVAIFLRKSQVEDFLNAVAFNLDTAFKAGVTHPALKLVQTKGRRSWVEGKELKIAAAIKKLGVKKPWTRKLIGITECEKQIGKGKLDKFTVLSEGKIELVHADDSRPAISGAEPQEHIE